VIEKLSGGYSKNVDKVGEMLDKIKTKHLLL
jgi:hypothetical protein